MTDYYIGSDNITGTEKADMEAIKKVLESNGHTCEVGTVTPEQEAASNSVDKSKTFIFMVGGVAPATYWSFKCAVEAGRSPHTIFAHAGWTCSDPSRPFNSKEAALSYEFKAEWDSGGFANQSAMDKDAGDAKTVGEYFQKYSQYITFCYSKTGPEDLAEQICQGTCTSGGGSNNSNITSSQGNGAVKIPDVTFYGLIKQIIGATDGLFVIANNMAFLLSFQDVFKHRIVNDEYIPKIEPSDVIHDTLKKNWSTSGYYNNVEITYADGIIQYGHDTLIKQYGEHTFYYDCPNDDYETAQAKAQALLSAHVRDYSTDIELQIFYNEHINAGSWVKLRKSLTQIVGKTRKERQQDILRNQGKKIETKHKGLTIANLSEEIIIKDNKSKKIYHITDEKGKEFDIEAENSEYDIFFVQSYTCKWDEYNSLIMNLHLKYGPDTPNDPINATIGSGFTNNTNGSVGGATGGQAEDINEFVQQCLGGSTNGTEQERASKIHEGLRAIIRYSSYSCSHYSTPSECLKNASKLNCADTARLTTACFKAAGLQAHVAHHPGHFWTEVQIDGKWVASDLTGCSGCQSKRQLGEVWSNMTPETIDGDEPSC